MGSKNSTLWLCERPWQKRPSKKRDLKEPQQNRHCERPQQKLSLKKRFGYLLGHLSFWVSRIESPLIFSIKKKIRKAKYTNTWLNFLLLINWIKITYLIIYIAFSPSYNLPKIHAFLSYLHSTQKKKKKNKEKTRSS